MSRTAASVLPILRDGPILRDVGRAVARQDNRLIPLAVFLGDIKALAEQLPNRPYVVNFCINRYRFTVAWFAAMIRGQVTLLPSSRDAGAVAALRADYVALYVLTDDDEAGEAPHFIYPALQPMATDTQVPAFPPDQIAAVLFTSGSTGRPSPSPRSWGRLVAGSLAAGSALDVARHQGAAVIATVPHAHSYGLESAVMLPLQHGLLLTAERPFFPADVASALAADRQPGLLVTTPVHLRALVGDAAEPGFGAAFRAGFVLSATAPLSGALAERAEAAFNAPVFEIYGCSEAGQLATRRTSAGPVWRCLDGFRLYNARDGSWASGPHEDDVLLADQIELNDSDGFILKGRTADLVNIAGKRSSLSFLTRQLVAIDGVRDGIFLMPEPDTACGTPRLAAVAVAPGLDAATILVRLRATIDAAFLPRPLLVVDTLPRNDLGKLARADILRLAGLPAIGSGVAPVEPINTKSVLLRFPADHPAGPGHFPGNPIVPGAVLLDALVQSISPAGWSGSVDAAKFHAPVRPGETVQVTRTTNGAVTRFEGRLTGTHQLVVSGVLRSPSPSH